MKTAEQIKDARNTLNAALHGLADIGEDDLSHELADLQGVLNWVLEDGDATGAMFAQKLKLIKDKFAKYGIEYKELPVPIERRQFGHG